MAFFFSKTTIGIILQRKTYKIGLQQKCLIEFDMYSKKSDGSR